MRHAIVKHTLTRSQAKQKVPKNQKRDFLCKIGVPAARRFAEMCTPLVCVRLTRLPCSYAMRVQALNYGDYGDPAKMTHTKMAFASRPSVPFVSLASACSQRA